MNNTKWLRSIRDYNTKKELSKKMSNSVKTGKDARITYNGKTVILKRVL